MTDFAEPKIAAARALYYKLFYVPGGFAPRDPVGRVERHGYVWDDDRWRYDPDEACQRGQTIDYGRIS